MRQLQFYCVFFAIVVALSPQLPGQDTPASGAALQPKELFGYWAVPEPGGDIFYIIGLVGSMVLESGERSGLEAATEMPKIRKSVQRKVIRTEAGKFLDYMRGIRDGDRLVDIVTSFGKIAYSYLIYRNSSNENGNPPHQASRIEPYESLNLSDDAQLIYEELLRYSLFIEDPRGKSRRGHVVPRLYLRRSLLPFFNLTFSRRDSVELEAWEVEQLLLDPIVFEKAKRLKGPSGAKAASSRRDQKGQMRIEDEEA